MRQEIVALSGLAEDELIEVAECLQEHYEHWCYDYKGPDLADSFMGFCEMLQQWPIPWPCSDVMSCLNGRSLAQFFFAIAYQDIDTTVGILTGRTNQAGLQYADFDYDDAACFVIPATKALMRAKHLLGTVENRIAQEAGAMHG